MKKAVVIPLIIVGSVFVVAGSVLLGLGLSNEIKQEEILTHTYEIKEAVTNFELKLNTADLEFKVSTDGTNKIVLEEKEKQYHEVKEENGTLFINAIDTKPWYEKIFMFSFKKMTVTFYLTETSYETFNLKSATGDVLIPGDFTFENETIELSTGDINSKAIVNKALSIKTNTGDVTLTDIKPESLTLITDTGNTNLENVEVTNDVVLSASTGRINVKNSKAVNANIKTSTGKVNLEGYVGSGSLEINTSTGDVVIADSDAASINIATSTGDVNATFLTGKSISYETRTGDVNVPSSIGEPCHIKTSTGDITVAIKG